jgi:hypothetical protein
MHARQSLVTAKDEFLDSTAVFDYGSGRLRYLCQNALVVELKPPHSWTYIATVANNEHWGTRPTPADLVTVLHSLRASETRKIAENMAHESPRRRYLRWIVQLPRSVRQVLTRFLPPAACR